MKKYPKKIHSLLAAVLILLCLQGVSLAADLSPDDVVAQIEARYSNQGFTANFMQQSTIRALQITDFAEGRLAMVYPGKMRWEYTEPEHQLIIANKTKLWVYRPADNQVMTGDPRSFFSIGKGASFLSDITTLRKNFTVTFPSKSTTSDYRLKLTPVTQHPDIAEIYLTVTKADYRIYQISTVNHYGDTTDIELFDIRFGMPDDSLFTFQIPAGVDVVQLDN